MQPKAAKDQAAYLRDMVESAKQAASYVRGLTFEQFWGDPKTRDAVAMRLHVIGEAAKHVTAETAAALPNVPFPRIRGMRNRIAHDYGAVNFRVVWTVTQEELKPMLTELERYLRQQARESVRVTQSRQSQLPGIHPPPPRNGPRLGM